MLLFALELIKSQQFSQAEEVYLELWLRLTQHCRTTQECEWHEKKIEVMLAYSSFLMTHKRVEEASAVLICCWNEYSEHQVSVFESVILQLKRVAVSMKAIGLVSLSLTVFQKCWSWFKSTHRESSTEFKQIEEYIATTSKEVVRKSTSTSTTTTTIATSSESVIREVFEESFASSSEETEITTTTVELCESLTSIYTEQQRWSEAISVIKSTLKKSWAAFFSESIESITMTSTFSSESIELVLKLASCYISEKRYEKAEDLYLRLYRVHRKVYALDHASVIRFGELYLEFLKKYDMFSHVISFYQEILVQYRSFYGPSHTKTIAILYSLGDICRRHHMTHGYWIEYYLEIVATLNKGALVCHEDAFRALIIVAEHYYETLRYSESLIHFRSIVATFVKSGTKFRFFEDQAAAQALFEKYYRAIEETKIEVEEHVKVLREIREACCRHYGESSTVAVSATVVLAETCSRSEKYEYEAASYYEHIIKNSKTVSTTVAKRSQSTLKSLYVKQAISTSSSSSSTSTTVTKEMIEKATAMTYERYTEIRKTHSCTHSETLTHLRELVTLYQRQEKSELAVRELRSLVVDTFTSVTSSRELIAVARDVASIYTSSSYVAQGLALVRELKLQIVYKTASKGCGFDVTKAGRASFAFIASLEYYLRADYSLTVAVYMAELMAEHLYYGRFISCIATKSKTGVVVLHAARLREILYRTGRGADFDAIVERQAVDYFAVVEAAVVKKSSKASVVVLVRVLLVHFAERTARPTNFVGSAGHAAVAKLTHLLAEQKHQAALELARCTFAYLMAHEGLDDPTEITLGFQLCLMMAGRGGHSHPTDAALSKSMLDLSRAILGEVFAICEASRIDLARCPLAELNELAGLVGDQKDHARLQWLLTSLWTSREGQTSWTPEVILTLGRRLVQAQFAGGNHAAAIRLAEDLVYNVRRVHGPRHKQTLDMYALLASLYTSAGQYCQAQAAAAAPTPTAGNGKGGNNAPQQQQPTAEARQRMAGLARTYFKKAIFVNEDVLKLIVDATAEDSDADDDGDQYSVASGHSNRGTLSVRGRGLGSRRSSSHLTRLVAGMNGNGNVNNNNETNGREATDNVSSGKTAAAVTATATHASSDPEAPFVLAEAARRHLRLLKLAVQRFGGWGRPTAGRQVHALTARVWKEFGPELKLKEDEALSSKWKVDGFGGGRAEAGLEEDGFKIPTSWAIY